MFDDASRWLENQFPGWMTHEGCLVLIIVMLILLP